MKKYGTILLIDDESDLGEMYKAIFSSTFEKVIFCDDANSAIEEVQKNDLSVIVSDFNMPGLNGTEFLAKIRSLGILTPVIFLTGCASKDFAIKAIKLGAVDILEKPINISNLEESVDRVLEIEKRKRNLDHNNAKISERKMIGLLQVVNEKKNQDSKEIKP